MNTITDTLYYFMYIVVELTILFLAISTLVGILLMYIPQEKMNRWMTRKGIFGNIFGAIVGALTPFCACSTVPMTVGFLEMGISFGAVMSFVIASPLLNPIIIGMMATVMGLKVTIVYFFVTFIASIVFGIILEKLGFKKYLKKVRVKGGNTRENVPVQFGQKFKKAFSGAWEDYRSVLAYLLVGVAIGAVIYGYLPQEFIVKIAGPDQFFAIPIASIIGVPLYIRAESAIPIGLSLMDKGMSTGAVMALIIGGAGMAIPEMTMLSSIFKKKLVATMVVVIFLTATIGGYIFNII
ncbi:permease [Fervidibacillus albus]|uniref:Permease n=1 Tax=Fervidibacillus albus TaxID=2980026 RepID=A0A9E8LSQ6_9BACI|nr:permease [Fervidibacillus albus]WAA08905.1 permease [Fervidibacillus albus]